MNWRKLVENKKKVIVAAVSLLVLIIVIIILLMSCGDKKGSSKPAGNDVVVDNNSGKEDKDDVKGDGESEEFEGGLQVADPEDEQVIEDTSTDISEYFEDVVDVEEVEPECKDEKHNVKHVKKVAATTEKAGNIEYWYCKDCKKYFADADCTELIKGGKKAVVIPKKTESKDEPQQPDIEIEEVEKPDDCVSKEHDVQHVEEKKATKEAEGNIEYWYCKDCDKYYRDAACTQWIVNGKEDTVTPKLPENLEEDTPGWGRFY